jgi:hypothetical protein
MPRPVARPSVLPAVLLAGLLASVGSAQSLDLEITLAAPSGISAELCQDAPLVGGCDTANTDIVGSFSFQVNQSAGTVTLVGFTTTTTSGLEFNYTGLFSFLDIGLGVVDASYAGVGPTGPVTLGEDGSFVFPGVLVNIAGMGDAMGSIFGIASINETLDLAAFSPVAVDLAGTLVESGGVYTLDGSFTFGGSSVVEPNIPVTASIESTVTITGTGIGTPSGCPASFDGDGDADIFDILAFLAAWNMGDPRTDLNDNGSADIFDVLGFLEIWNMGCP